MKKPIFKIIIEEINPLPFMKRYQLFIHTLDEEYQCYIKTYIATFRNTDDAFNIGSLVVKDLAKIKRNKIKESEIN